MKGKTRRKPEIDLKKKYNFMIMTLRMRERGRNGQMNSEK